MQCLQRKEDEEFLQLFVLFLSVGNVLPKLSLRVLPIERSFVLSHYRKFLQNRARSRAGREIGRCNTQGISMDSAGSESEAKLALTLVRGALFDASLKRSVTIALARR